jgi:hypothetical protein
MLIFQAFDENTKKKKVTFSSNLPFGTNIGRGHVLSGLCPKGMYD